MMLDGRSFLTDDLPEADLLQLFHELEVHQVELEIQGEELRLKNLELKELLYRYTDLYHQAPIGFVSLNTKGTIVEANQAASEMLGIPKDKLRRRGFSRLIHIEDQYSYFKLLNELNKIPFGKARGELRLVKDSISPFYVHIEIVPLKNDREKVEGWLVAFLDISRSKSAEEALHVVNGQLQDSQRQLKSLSARLLSVQEEERMRIATELHDSLGQTLAAIKFSVENVLENSQRHNPDEAFRLLERFIPVIQGSIDEVRNIYMGLRPVMLDDLGIVATIEWFCREFRTAFPNLRIEIATPIEEKDIPEDLKIVIFRIIQEALNNVAKHSRAKSANLSLVKNGDQIELTIEDNGVGFDVEALAQEEDLRSVGLASMKERAEISGGTLFIKSIEGHGTSICAKWKV
jgi:PAS domain S-box-containing protein